MLNNVAWRGRRKVRNKTPPKRSCQLPCTKKKKKKKGREQEKVAHDPQSRSPPTNY